jgi:hypothetical protein
MSTWANKITTSIFGRRLGINRLTTGESGGAQGARDFLAGPEAYRTAVSTANTTGTNVAAYGVQVLPGTSAASSSVYTIDPPIPGVTVVVVGSSNAGCFLKTNAATETIMTTLGSSDTVLEFPSVGGVATLTGVTTARWVAQLTTGVVASTST